MAEDERVIPTMRAGESKGFATVKEAKRWLSERGYAYERTAQPAHQMQFAVKPRAGLMFWSRDDNRRVSIFDADAVLDVDAVPPSALERGGHLYETSPDDRPCTLRWCVDMVALGVLGGAE